MVVESTRLGSLEIEEKDIIRFPQGLPGFANEKAFALIPYGAESPFAFLQSVAKPDLTFLITEPFTFFADYQFEFADETAKTLGVSDNRPPLVFSIVTIPGEKLEEMTANLLAPIVINPEERVAVQVVLEKVPYTTRHRLFPNGFPKKRDKGEK